MTPTPSPTRSGGNGLLASSRLLRVLRYPDFRLLWIGAFLSFTGGRVENVAQGYFVFQMTGDEFKLSLTAFAWNLPVLVFGLIAGSISDHIDKRAVLIWTQVAFALNALFLAAATYFGFVTYWEILLVSFLNGLVSCIEMPTRQSIVSRVVPPEELAAAVPVNAMTFNVARICGPALGGLLLTWTGVAACYFLNGVSFLALVWSGFAIKADLRSNQPERGPMKDLVFEGALYTFRDPRLRTLFVLETFTACFGMAYLPLLPAYVHEVLGMTSEAQAKQGLGFTYTAVGIGALVGLVVITQLADSPRKGLIIRLAMWGMSLGLLLLSFMRAPLLAYPTLSVLGAAAIMQLNTTNALFQLLSPDRLRGRVLAMHIWALNGLAPFGVLLSGWIAKASNSGSAVSLPFHGVSLAMAASSLAMAIGAIGAVFARRGLSNLVYDPSAL